MRLLGFLPVLMAVVFWWPVAAGAESLSGRGVSSGYPDLGRALSNERVRLWRSLVGSAAGRPEAAKLAAVNDFFNATIQYGEDRDVWGLEDYWATPLELLLSGKGDCEDYAIAKFFSLIELGVLPERMRLYYVRISTDSGVRSHMVLGVDLGGALGWVVLDNMQPEIRTFSTRSDIEVVFGFGCHEVWQGRPGEAFLVQVGAERLTLWRNLLGRLGGDPFGGTVIARLR